MHVSPDDTRSEFLAAEVPDLAQLAGARTDFAEWLAGVGLTEDRVGELAVAFSELVANAVRESPPGADPASAHAVLGGDGRLVLEVSNEVAATSPEEVKEHWDLNDPLRTGGRGLLLVSAFVDDIVVDVAGERLVIRCSIAVPV